MRKRKFCRYLLLVLIAQVSSMSAAVNNHQLPSYMSGFLYPLGNKKGVYSFVR